MPVAVIPFKQKNPKTRLSCVLSQSEREEFAKAMMLDVVAAVKDAMCRPVILGTEPFESDDLVQVAMPEKGLSDALNEYLSCALDSVLIIMADIPLADEASVRRVIATQSDLSIVPGRGGGTNVIFIRDPAKFRVDYYGGSFAKHMKIAADAGLSVEVIDSFRLHTDIDEKEDLPELLIHGKGKSRAYLEEKGFTLISDKGRTVVERKQ
ncbi:MAG TPA: 2-phospho-L-lactate guanylyltransferase [Methanoregulaceae archaeon]|nr:2-phospho-L-lactate guanylyltransferase [Methanoregulaceae archaeon]HRY74801.1 2-phospho-L-lactate guanylyltransferase [Methanoregulaceae archaeon]